MNIKRMYMLLTVTWLVGMTTMLGAKAAGGDSATVNFTATFTPPPCTVDIGGSTTGSVDLGALVSGSNIKSPFTLNVTCVTGFDRPSQIYATIGAGVQDTTATAIQMVNTGGPGTPVLLTLTSADKPTGIVYGSSGATDGTRQFCSGAATRSCILTPTAVVNTGTPAGTLSASVVFTMVNP